MMPFPGGAESMSNGTLIFSLGASVFYLNMLDNAPNLRRTAAKMLTVLLLALLAVMESGPVLLVAALAACALGDGLLSRGGNKAFLGGLAAFLAGHLLYVALFISIGEGAGLILRPERAVIAAVMAPTSVFLLLRLRAAIPPDMKLPVVAYTVAIVAMGLCALTVPGPWIVLGALSFMASDAMLGTERFLPIENVEFRTLLRHSVWILYYLGQAMITLGILLGGSAI